MNILFKLCKSIIKRNKAFSICILLMSILSVSIGFLGVNFGISSENTINKFLVDSSMPDGIFLTDVVDDDVYKSIEDIDGVNKISKRFIYDTSIETNDKNIYSVRIFRYDLDSPYKYTVHCSVEYNGDLPKLSIASEFAAYNNINVGDHIFINTALGKKEAVIKEIVSSPETMNCVKDDMSFYEGYQFTYIYVNNNEFEKIIDLGNVSNQVLVYFDEELDIASQKECMNKVDDKLDEHVISKTFTLESEELNNVHDDLNTIGVICKFVPAIIWLISLGFNFIFIKIIVDNQRKNIGLLRALGFGIKKIVFVFVLYTIIVNLPAIIMGSLFGYKLLATCVKIIAESKGIIETCITILPIKTIAIFVINFIIGIVAVLLSVNSISNIDPSVAYGGIENSNYEPPKFISKLNVDSFIKISIVSIFRNYKRQIVGSLCICACIVCMCIGLEGVLTIGHPIDAVYGDRYKYDLMIRNINQETIDRINNEVDGILLSEEARVFTSTLFGKDVRVSTINKTDELTVLKNNKGDIIYPEKGIIIDEMCAKINNISIGEEILLDKHPLKVEGIAREILGTVMYISEDAAEELGKTSPNCLSLRLVEGTDINKIEDEISIINNDAYFVELASQKANIKDAFTAMRTVMFVFAILAFLIGSLLIINITIIDFNENRIKYSTLRAIGTPIKRLIVVSLIQNLSRIILGIIVSIPLSYISNTILLELLSGASQQYVMVNYNGCFIVSCLFPLLYIIFGTIISRIKIKKLDFCSSLNEME